MRTLFGINKTLAIVAVTAVAALTFHSFAQSSAPKPQPPAPADLKITLKFKNAMVKDEDAFSRKLAKMDKKQYQVRMKHANASKPDEDFPPTAPAQSEIKTDKVTVSEFAKNGSTEELTVIGPHVTQAVTSASKDDIQAVLDELQ